jgi:uncharacterized protein
VRSKVHIFTQLNKHFALDVGSGAVHVLSHPAFRLLELVNAREARTTGDGRPCIMPEHIPSEILQDVINIDDIHEAWGALYSLYNDGMLFSEDDSEDIDLPDKMPLKALCVHIAHDCNLRCKYCFAEEIIDRAVMTPETAKDAVDFLISGSADREHLEMDFFGGEP